MGREADFSGCLDPLPGNIKERNRPESRLARFESARIAGPIQAEGRDNPGAGYDDSPLPRWRLRTGKQHTYQFGLLGRNVGRLGR